MDEVTGSGSEKSEAPEDGGLNGSGVIPISGRRGRRQGKVEGVVAPPAKGKPRRAINDLDLVKQFRDTLSGIILEGDPNAWPPFPATYRILEDRQGIRTPLLVDERGVCRLVDPSAVAGALAAYSIGLRSRAPSGELELTVEDAAKIARQWTYCQEPLPEARIAPVAFLSDTGLCWQRTDFDPAPGPTPTWDGLLARCSNAPALEAWIGSLFYADSPRQQYCWLSGQYGGEGKGSLLRFLSRLMGPSYRSEESPKTADKFWTSGLVGARLVAFTDCSDPAVVRNGRIKALTGDDMMRVEFKGRPVAYMEFICKLLFASNHLPEISGSGADTRRIIHVRMEPLEEAERVASGVFDERLWGEREKVIHRCISAFRGVAHMSAIPVDKSDLEDLAASNEEGYADVVLRFFKLEQGAYLLPGDFLYILKELAGFQDRQIAAFKEYLHRQGVRHKQVRAEGGHQRRYLGLTVAEEVRKNHGPRLTTPERAEIRQEF